MMSDYYTSYETSLALRDAGAPQDREENEPSRAPHYWCDDIGEYGYPIGRHFGCQGNTHPRAFRADEIIEALGDRLASMYRDLVDEPWFAVIDAIPVAIHFEGPSLVEALAAAWLAVLKEGK